MCGVAENTAKYGEVGGRNARNASNYSVIPVVRQQGRQTSGCCTVQLPKLGLWVEARGPKGRHASCALGSSGNSLDLVTAGHGLNTIVMGGLLAHVEHVGSAGTRTQRKGCVHHDS